MASEHREMASERWERGSWEDALSQSNSKIITEALAEKYLNQKNALGMTLRSVTSMFWGLLVNEP